MQQMQISLKDVERRKEILGLTETELSELLDVREKIIFKLDHMVTQFYDEQISIPEVNSLIGDNDTLKRLKIAQHQYVLDLFSGNYDNTYVNNRLRIGMVHKRIGVEPRLYLAAFYHLKMHIFELVHQTVKDATIAQRVQKTLEKLYIFDITLVMETYIWSLLNEINNSKNKLQEYAISLELHAQQMENLSQIDPLSGLFNVRTLLPILNNTLIRAQQQKFPITVVFIDINDFKKMNDQYGHLYGDYVIKSVASALKKYAREEDYCFRYGGDEFFVVLPNCTESDAVVSFIPRVEAQLKQLDIPVSLSVGIHQNDEETGYLDSYSLIRCADHKMYEVKKSNRVMD
jgi:diguanylate cyclase